VEGILMGDIKNVLVALAAIALGIHLVLYFSGRLRLSDDDERIRQARINKHGTWPIMLGVVSILVGVALLAVTFVL
jgi:hypothetical protein